MISITNFNKKTSLIISIIIACINGLMAFINLSEFYIVGILNKTDGYPFSGEGQVPYYYETAELYSKVNLIWGLLFLMILIFVIKAIVDGNMKRIFLSLGLTLLLLFSQFIHSQIGIF